MKTLQEIQKEVYLWSHKNFGDQPSYKPLLGVSEEVWELCHAHLKSKQGIRTNEDHRLAKIDAIADTIIYLLDYAGREGIDVGAALNSTWEQVSKRDWSKNTQTGV